MPDVYKTILEAIHPHLGARAVAVLEEGLKRLGKRPSELTPEDGAHLLKGLVYRELQARMRPEEARQLVEGVLAQMEGQGARLAKLEQGLKRFGLYVDWPEVARLRALVNRLRQAEDPGLLQEGKTLLDALEEKLEEALLRQAKDLAHLEEALERVRHLGGPKVRRLESLVETIRQAQREGILAQAEVERARSLALELRKFLESSAVRSPTLPEIVFETQETLPLPTSPTKSSSPWRRPPSWRGSSSWTSRPFPRKPASGSWPWRWRRKSASWKPSSPATPPWWKGPR